MTCVWDLHKYQFWDTPKTCGLRWGLNLINNLSYRRMLVDEAMNNQNDASSVHMLDSLVYSMLDMEFVNYDMENN